MIKSIRTRVRWIMFRRSKDTVLNKTKLACQLFTDPILSGPSMTKGYTIKCNYYTYKSLLSYLTTINDMNKAGRFPKTYDQLSMPVETDLNHWLYKEVGTGSSMWECYNELTTLFLGYLDQLDKPVHPVIERKLHYICQAIIELTNLLGELKYVKTKK